MFIQVAISPVTIKAFLIGVCAFEPESSIVVNYHPNLLKEFRGSLSKEFTVKALEWLYNNATMYNKVNTKFPEKYKHIEQYAKSIGFKFEGIDRESCSSGDRLMYGITRKEIERLLCQ